MLTIGVVFGSRSAEHEVSIASAYATMVWLEKTGQYKVCPIYIDHEGRWISDDRLRDLKGITEYRRNGADNIPPCTIDFSKPGKLHLSVGKSGIFSGPKETVIDVVFPVLHGKNGEDGTIQGLCEMLRVPYVSPSVLGSALALNKIAMKEMFQSLGLPITKFRAFHEGENIDYAIFGTELQYPLFVKPANLGSSIGVSRAKDEAELKQAIEVAFHYDPDIIVEEGVSNLRELFQCVMEQDGKIVTSLIQQPVTDGKFLSFDEKYTGETGGTMQGFEEKVITPAPISDSRTAEIGEMSKRIFSAFFCEGGAPRIDYLYDQEADLVYVNEINTIPGALQMQLWEKSGLSQAEFLNSLIHTAISRNAKQDKSIDFQSNILDYTLSFVRK